MFLSRYGRFLRCEAVDGLVDGLSDEPRRLPVEPHTLLYTGAWRRGPELSHSATSERADEDLRVSVELKRDASRGGLTGRRRNTQALRVGHMAHQQSCRSFVRVGPASRVLAFPCLPGGGRELDWTILNFATDRQRIRFMADILNATKPISPSSGTRAESWCCIGVGVIP